MKHLIDSCAENLSEVIIAITIQCVSKNLKSGLLPSKKIILFASVKVLDFLVIQKKTAWLERQG